MSVKSKSSVQTVGAQQALPDWSFLFLGFTYTMHCYTQSQHIKLILDNLQIKELLNLTNICTPPIGKSMVEAMKSECRNIIWCVIGSIQQIIQWKNEFTEINTIS